MPQSSPVLSYFVAVFWWEFYQLPFWAWSANLRINFGRNYLSHGPQILHHCQYVVYLFSFRSNQFIYLKNAWALSHEFKLVPFSSRSCVIRKEWRQLHSVFFISVEYFCHRKWIKSRSVLWNSQIKIIKISLVLKIWDKWYNKWIITQGAGTPCFFRMLFKNEFHAQMSSNNVMTYISLCQKCRDPSIFIS